MRFRDVGRGLEVIVRVLVFEARREMDVIKLVA